MRRSSRPRCPRWPSRSREDPIKLNLAITSYLLSLAVFIPISGWMADHFGARTVFRTAIVIFTIRFSILRILEFAAGAGRRAYFARLRRRHDGPGRPPDRSEDHRQVRTGHRDVLSDRARRAGSGGRATGRRLHRDVLFVALDFLHQRADRRARFHAGHLVHPQHPRGNPASRSTSADFCSPGWGWRAWSPASSRSAAALSPRASPCA